jgi:hypothetical protein
MDLHGTVQLPFMNIREPSASRDDFKVVVQGARSAMSAKSVTYLLVFDDVYRVPYQGTGRQPFSPTMDHTRRVVTVV